MLRDSTLPVLGVAAYGLPCAPSLPDHPLRPPEWEALVKEVRAHRIAGLFMQAVYEGSLPVDEQQRGQASSLFMQARAYTMTLQSHLLRVAELLEQAGVDYRVLKGASLAALAYPDQSLRTYGDVDLLVRPAEFEYAVEFLERVGYRRAQGWHRVGRAHDKSVVLVAGDSCAIDLHYALARGPYKWLVASSDLFAEPQTFELGPRWLPALSPHAQFLHVCLHALLGDLRPRLLSIRDVVQCAVDTDLDWAVARQLCVKWQVTGVVSAAMRAAQDLLGVSFNDPARSLASHQPTTRERRLMQPYEAQRKSYVVFLVNTLTATPGMARKAVYAYNLLLPGKNYMRSSGYESHRARWRHAGRAATALLVGRLRRSLRRNRAAASDR